MKAREMWTNERFDIHGTQTLELSQRTIDCVVRHMESLREQSLEKETAAFGKPCAGCPHFADCQCDWIDAFHPLAKRSNVEFSVAALPHPETKDSQVSDRTQ